MKCLIIGDARLFGSMVAEELLAYNCDVALLDEHPLPGKLTREVQRIDCDVDHLASKRSDIEAFKPDSTIHLGARNELHALSLINTMEGLNSHLVVASSLNVYRANGRVYKTENVALEDAPIAETAPLRSEPLTAKDPGNDKLHVELALSESTVPSTILRLPPMYGPGDPLRRMYPLIYRMIDKRPFIVIPESQANWRWTHGYMPDMAHGVALAAMSGTAQSKVYNLGELKTPTIIERISHLATVFDWEGKLTSLPDAELPDYLITPGDFEQDLEFDSSKIRAELSYKEKGDYYDSLYEVLEWYKSNPPPGYDGKGFDYSAEDELTALVDRAQQYN